MNNISFKKLIVGLLVLLFSCNIFAQEKKVALIWGNATYSGKWQTINVVKNDANTMNNVLKSIGFQTKLMVDGTTEEMKSSLREFTSMAKNADIAIFYYSGHAISINEGYYLIPSKTQLPDNLLTSDLLPMQDIMIAMRGSRLKLLFFDSCRDNITIDGLPKGNPNILTPNDVGPTGERDTESPSGIMMFYSAERGKKTHTGSGSLSTFTKVLSEHITDGDEFRTVWKNIRNDVFLIQKQNPSEEGFYEHDLYLNPSGKRQASPSQPSSSNSNKKSITIKTNAPGSVIDFSGNKYDADKPLLFAIGETYTYTITADGYKQHIGKLVVTDSTPSIINVTLEKNEPATLYVTSNVPAEVVFDGVSLGKTPILLNSTSGTHTISLKANGYYPHSTNIDLVTGTNSKSISLIKESPWFFDWDRYAPTSHISYMYSPKYQFGLQYLKRLEGTHALLGANISISTNAFKGLEWGKVVVTTSSTSTSSVTYSVVDGNGNVVEYKNETTITYSDQQEDYSEEIDPYNEAEVYTSNSMYMLSGGYQPCNGIVFETGFGLFKHSVKHYMPYSYAIRKTVKTNTSTGEVVGEPEYNYTRINSSHWYKDNTLSPAMRLGMKVLIPLGKYKENCITLGGGYTIPFGNTEFGSWDATVGIAWHL